MRIYKLQLVIIIIVAMSLNLGGCIRFKLDSPKPEEIKGDEFNKILAREYLKYSQAKLEKGQKRIADIFAAKSIRTSSGRDVDPEHPEDWEINSKSIQALKNSRRDLLNKINNEIILSYPKAAARAYFLYDCWVVSEEKPWISEYDPTCRVEFVKVMEYLEKETSAETVLNLTESALGKKMGHNTIPETDNNHNIIDEMLIEKAEKNQETKKEEIASGLPGELPTPLPQALPQPVSIDQQPGNQSIDKQEESAGSAPQQDEFAILFDFDTADLTVDGGSVIDKVAENVKNSPSYEIVINGYTDSVGTDDYNLKLSIKRAETIANELIKKGIDKNRIQSYGFGESDLSVITPDNKKEPKNRRVEIFIQGQDEEIQTPDTTGS